MQGVQDIYLAGNDDDRWSDVLSRYCEDWQLRDIALFTAHPGERTFSSVVNAALPIEVHNEYLADFAHYDTQILRLLDGGERQLTGTDLLSVDEAQHCPVHNDYLIPHDIDRQIVWYFKTTQGSKHTCTFIKGADDGHFTPELLAEFAGLVPHVKASLELAMQASRSERIAADILNRFGFAIVALDARARVSHVNTPTNDLIEAGHLEIDAQGMLRGTHPAWQQAITRALEAGRANAAFRHSDYHCEVPFAIEVLNAPGDANRESHTVLQIRDYQHAITDVTDCFGATPAEANLALHLFFGGTLDSHAQRNGTSINTVRSQLRGLFEKTSTQRQKDLVAALAEILR